MSSGNAATYARKTRMKACTGGKARYLCPRLVEVVQCKKPPRVQLKSKVALKNVLYIHHNGPLNLESMRVDKKCASVS